MNLTSSLDSYFESAMSSVHTSLPAKVVKYDENKHRATVKPSVRMLLANGVEIELPELMDVPVLYPSAKSFDLEFPLEKDDGVLLVFQEQDISDWKNDEKEPAALTASRFNLDSAVAIPGMFSKPNKGRVRIYVDKDGVLTWSAKKIVFDGQLVVNEDLLVRGDVFAGPAPTGPGVSLKQHIHPSAAGPTSPATPNIPIPAEK